MSYEYVKQAKSQLKMFALNFISFHSGGFIVDIDNMSCMNTSKNIYQTNVAQIETNKTNIKVCLNLKENAFWVYLFLSFTEPSNSTSLYHYYDEENTTKKVMSARVGAFVRFWPSWVLSWICRCRFFQTVQKCFVT